MTLPDFSDARISADPFPHARMPAILAPRDADGALAWLRDHAPWRLRVESFYEQHEFSLLDRDLGPGIAALASSAFVDAVGRGLGAGLGAAGTLACVDVTAHRLTAGQTIRIHNDHLEGRETHRLLIQLNDGWTADRGGLLMLFSGDAPETLRHVVMPTHASGFAFAISPASFHAVSTIKSGKRYTLVYTFREEGRRP